MVFVALHQRMTVAVELALPRTGAADAPAQPDRVVVTSPERGLQVQPRVDGEADHVAVAPVARGAHECPQRAG